MLIAQDKIYYQALSPSGTVLGTAMNDPTGLSHYLQDHVLSLDDHAKYSVATYKESRFLPGKAQLVNQISAEDFVAQVRRDFAN